MTAVSKRRTGFSHQNDRDLTRSWMPSFNIVVVRRQLEKTMDRSDQHKAGIEAAALALSLMASDNNMSRTSKRPEIDETLAAQALRLVDVMEEDRKSVV